MNNELEIKKTELITEVFISKGYTASDALQLLGLSITEVDEYFGGDYEIVAEEIVQDSQNTDEQLAELDYEKIESDYYLGFGDE